MGAAVAFRDVGDNGDRRPLKLAGQPVFLSSRKVGRMSVAPFHQVHPFLPDVQAPISFQRQYRSPHPEPEPRNPEPAPSDYRTRFSSPLTISRAKRKLPTYTPLPAHLGGSMSQTLDGKRVLLVDD